MVRLAAATLVYVVAVASAKNSNFISVTPVGDTNGLSSQLAFPQTPGRVHRLMRKEFENSFDFVEISNIKATALELEFSRDALEHLQTMNASTAQVDPSTVGYLMQYAMTTLLGAVKHFIRSPITEEDIKAGLYVLRDNIKRMIFYCTPPEARTGEKWEFMKKHWDGVWEMTADLAAGIKKFADDGDGQALTQVFRKLLQKIADLVREIHPNIAKYIQVVADLIDKVGGGWAAFAQGDIPKGVEATYQGLRVVLDAAIPPEIKRSDVYTWTMGITDHVLGNLSGIVTEFQEHMKNANVCYIPGERWKAEEDGTCGPGFTAKNSLCVPEGRDNGENCLPRCGKGGNCDWCGRDMACCQKNLKVPEECSNVRGFKHAPIAARYHQCVRVLKPLPKLGLCASSCPGAGDCSWCPEGTACCKAGDTAELCVLAAATGSKLLPIRQCQPVQLSLLSLSNASLALGEGVRGVGVHNFSAQRKAKDSSKQAHYFEEGGGEGGATNVTWTSQGELTNVGVRSIGSPPRVKKPEPVGLTKNCSAGMAMHKGKCYEICDKRSGWLESGNGQKCRWTCVGKFPFQGNGICAKSGGAVAQWAMEIVTAGLGIVFEGVGAALSWNANPNGKDAPDEDAASLALQKDRKDKLIRLVDKAIAFGKTFANPECDKCSFDGVGDDDE